MAAVPHALIEAAPAIDVAVEAEGERSAPEHDVPTAAATVKQPRNLDEAMAELASHAPPPAKERSVPRHFKAGAIVGCVLLVAVLAIGHRRKDSEDEKARIEVDDHLIVHESELRNRKEVSPLDFRPKVKSIDIPIREVVAPQEPSVEMTERRTRRANDPEDLIGRRHANQTTPSETETYRRPSVYFEESHADRFGHGESGGEPRKKALLSAGSVVSVVLATPLDLQGGSSTVIASVDKAGALPANAKLIGNASTGDDERINFRFHRLILPDGREAKIDAEGQDAAGHFGITAEVSGQGTEPSAAGDWARDSASAASDVAIDTVAPVPAASLARRIVRVRPRSIAPIARPRFSLAAGTPFNVFMHEQVVLEEQRP